jgi:ribulose kinase
LIDLKRKFEPILDISSAYSTKHIIESLYQSGRPKFKSILICGGLSKNKLYVQTHADVCGIPVLISKEEESVLVGAAMLGATASGLYKNLEAAVEDLSNSCYEVSPDGDSCDFHDRKFKVFMKMLEDQRSYGQIMASN